MIRNNYQWIVLESVSASSGVVFAKNRIMYVDGNKFFKYDDVQPNTIVKETAITSATAGVITFTVGATPGNSATYTLQFYQPIPSSSTQSTTNNGLKTYTVVTPATGTPTATTVADQFRLLFTAEGTTYVTATGTATLIITANTNFPIITGGAWFRDGSGTASTVTQTTQGIAIRGTGALLKTIGGPTTMGDATNYTIYYKLSFENIGETNTMRVNQGWPTVIALAESGTNYSTAITAIDLYLDAYSAGTTFDTETVSVKGQEAYDA